ncbi:Uncharacterised protein [Starkeya nomas]|uniref:Lysozyme inhibitor LprI N-terminal domain-containing protein n=1 Tax=Starkeya nomas TaxID=2666134 RepID=A0A5S9NGM6_9HYPH|nr:hypothetical protein [Starkeya nomas]CAA0089294.1 Uncharacterised protein [Starkeya nomas]
MSRISAATLVALGLALPSLEGTPAAAASFDCGRTRTPDERAVCATPALSALDSEMGALWYAYSRFPLLMGASGARRDDAQAFLTARGACGADAACLARLYEARIATLKEQVASAIGNLARQADADAPPAPPAPQPVIDRIAAFGRQCRELGGTLKGNAAPETMTGDLDRDGRPDYVLNSANLRCEGAATAFCANDGCTVAIALSSAGYAPLDLRGANPTLAQEGDATTLALWVDRFACDGAKPGDACWSTWRWDGSALKASLAVHPQ